MAKKGIKAREMNFIAEGAPPREPKSSTIETKPTAEKKNPDIQPSKTQKSGGDETKKENRKIIVNSVIEQNVVQHVEETGKGEVRG